MSDVVAAIITLDHKTGNDMADALARVGALQHSIDPDAASFQYCAYNMTIDIVLARSHRSRQTLSVTM